MRSRGRATAGTLLGTAAALAIAASRAIAAVPHTVQPGETLSGIAAYNGISTASLAAYNGISPETFVITGQTIQVPAIGEAPTTTSTTPMPTTASTTGGHTVVLGETLSSIAAANGVTADALAAANGISLTTPIIEGQTLTIPAASSTTSSSTTTSSAGTHTVVAGETLSSIGAANGVSADSIASANGISIYDPIVVGQELTIPAVSVSTAATSSGISLAPIYCPCGTVYLRSDAASQWEAMRQDSLSYYGMDIYPDGPVSAYRTYDQQAQLYQQYLDGTGAPANPPGTSSHELGTAVDVATPTMRSIVDSIGSQFGWGKIHGPDEWWHVDYYGGG